MNSDSADSWSCECDIEIAFPALAISLGELLDDSLLDRYETTDRSDTGWGQVVAIRNTWVGDRRDLSTAIEGALGDLGGLLSAVNNEGVVRIGVYYSTFNFTLNLGHSLMSRLTQLSLALEISLYPTDFHRG